MLCSSCVNSPTLPVPTRRRSTSMTGEICAPVPQRSSSSHVYSSVRSMLRSTTVLPSSSLITVISSVRVTPSRMSSVTGGFDLVASEKLAGRVHGLFGRVGTCDPPHVGRPPQALVMRGSLQQMKLLLLRVPVGADALEAPSPVVERVRHQAQLGVVI